MLDLTQSDFAKILNIKQSYYSEVEGGKREVTSKLVKNLILIFKISSDWIFTGNGDIHITNTDKPERHTADEWDINRTVNANDEPGIYKNSSTIPFYLDLHLDKKLILDYLKQETETGKLYKSINTVTTFSFIIESLDQAYFGKIREAEKNRDKYFKKHKFDYEGFKKNIDTELLSLMRFNPALQKLAKAIDEFYLEIQEVDTDNVIDSFLGRNMQSNTTK